MSKETDRVFDALAEHVMFLGAGTMDLKGRSLDYRKGKTFDDFAKAVRRGLAQGRGKLEFELGMISVQLRGVLRIVKPKRLKLACPKCQHPHVDAGEWAIRLHRKHLCEACDHVWQPSGEWTVGV